MSPDPKDLPAELDVLGAQLERAATAQLARRRAWRRMLRKGAVSVVVGTPLALAIAAGEVAPSSAPVERIARSGPVQMTVGASVATRFAERRPDAADAARGYPCVMYPDCRPDSAARTQPASAWVEPRRPPVTVTG